MKKVSSVLIVVLLPILLHAQQNIGIGTNSPHSSALVDMTSTGKGLLIPRMTSMQRSSIATPANGLMVYDTDTNGFWFYNGSSWGNVGAASSGWALNGNVGTDTATHFIGTSDVMPILFKSGNNRVGLLGGNLYQNIYFGANAGKENITGYHNIGIGRGALAYAKESLYAIAIGDSALSRNRENRTGQGNSEGIDNIAIGGSALKNNTVGNYNTAIGAHALRDNQNGNGNTALGYVSLYKNTTGGNNVGLGYGTLNDNTTGDNNVAVGFVSLNSNTTGKNNLAMGRSALQQSVTGDNNVALGDLASFGNQTGSSNISIGYLSLYHNKNKSNLVAIGDSALMKNGHFNNTPGEAERNTAVGSKAMALNTAGFDNTALGSQSLYSNTTGDNNTAIGREAMRKNTTGYFNASIGSGSLGNNTTGISNTAIGYGSLFNNNTGTHNIALGASSLLGNTTGTYNIGIGVLALQQNAGGKSNIAIGARALNVNSNRNNNIAIGDSALMNNSTGATLLTEGINNTAIGIKSMYNNTRGSLNTAIGNNAMPATTTGTNNTAIGNNTMAANISGGGNTMVGSLANMTGNNFSNAMALGYDAVVNSSNKVRIGNTNIISIEGQVPFSSPSDGRFKTNVTEEVQGLNFILKLRPVVYNFQSASYESFINGGKIKASSNDGALDKIRQTGFIAQEVEAAAKTTGYDFNGVKKPAHEQDTYSVSYAQFVVPLVKAVQEQQEQIIKLREEIEKLKKERK